jgi:hypothetical protein
MTTIERRGFAPRTFSLLVLLACIVLGPVDATALDWPTRDQIRNLHGEVEQLSAQFDTLDVATGADGHGDALDEHWRAMQQHLVSVRENGCRECGAKTEFEAANDRLPWATPRVSVPTYQEHMQTTLHAMHDRMSRLDHEKSPFERQRLLRQYWTRVYDQMQRLREPRP